MTEYDVDEETVVKPVPTEDEVYRQFQMNEPIAELEKRGVIRASGASDNDDSPVRSMINYPSIPTSVRKLRRLRDDGTDYTTRLHKQYAKNREARMAAARGTR